MTINTCPICNEPTHATEGDDEGRCATCSAAFFARARFAEYAAEIGSDPINEEHAIMSVGREFLPACALAVLDGGQPTAGYWMFLFAQTEQAQTEHDREITAGHEWHQ